MARSSNWECVFLPQGGTGCGPGVGPVDKEKVQKYCVGGDQPMTDADYGYLILILGWLGVFVGAPFLPWFANVVGVIAFVAHRASKVSLALAATAFGLGLDSFTFKIKRAVETGEKSYVDHLGLGFYVWEMSFLLLALYCLLNWLDTKQFVSSGTP
jgi:hypothetical protein